MAPEFSEREIQSSISALLGIDAGTPIDPQSMAESMMVTFPPPHERSTTLDEFSMLLREALLGAGVRVVPYDEALTPKGKLRPNIVVIEQGEGADSDLAINRVASLRETCLVGIYSRPCPANEYDTPQEKLDAIVQLLAWDFTHIPIFVNGDSWAFASMNGAIVDCGHVSQMKTTVSESLVPKLAAQIRPPDPQRIGYREGALDVDSASYQDTARDFGKAAGICRQNGLMHAHTRLDTLRFRNPFLKRLASAYLDHRTGMSYGFLAKQLPCDVVPAIPFSDCLTPGIADVDWLETPVVNLGGTTFVKVALGGQDWIVTLPEISVLCTRSGCDKTNISPKTDLVRMTLSDGDIVLDTAPSVKANHARPSYDTFAIFSHAIGNAIGASVLSAVGSSSEFVRALTEEGLSILHWHGYSHQDRSPLGYSVHGDRNPPVSCSTDQSAIYAIVGKLRAIDQCILEKQDFRGDLHVEPHHGTNLIGVLNLEQSAQWVDEHH